MFEGGGAVHSKVLNVRRVVVHSKVVNVRRVSGTFISLVPHSWQVHSTIITRLNTRCEEIV